MAGINSHRGLEQEVMKTMIYFDLFNYPLKSDEVFRFLQSNSVTHADVQNSLNKLASENSVFSFESFYSLKEEVQFIQRRVKGNEHAAKILPFARKRASLIAKFPFVRGVMASGSLSKDYIDETSDLDFFVVTAPGGLWIARTLIVLFKRIVLFNSHKYFCVNYFVDEDHMAIEERNIFTATELATLLPLANGDLYRRLIKENFWVKDFFPNYQPRNTSGLPSGRGGIFKKTLEALLAPFCSALDTALMNLTLNRFRRLYGHSYSEDDFKIAFKSTKYASKNHPQYYQRKVMSKYLEKLKEYKLGVRK